MPHGWDSGEHEPVDPRKWRDHNPRNRMDPPRGGAGGGGGKGSQKSGCALWTLMSLAVVSVAILLGVTL